jgi:hypothetical protein
MLSVLARRVEQLSAVHHPALNSVARQSVAMLARLALYVGALALFAIGAAQLWAGLPVAALDLPLAASDWSPASRSHPAFAVSQQDLIAKSESYEIYRTSQGGRKDIIRWSTAPGEKPLAEIELYRPGAELDQSGPPAAAIAARMDPDGMREIVGEGFVDSKFGPVALFGFADRSDDAHRCLGFMKNLEQASLRIGGWSCQSATLPARRAAIACILNRLTLLTAGNDPKLAELFARAELKRGVCQSGNAAMAASGDWVTGAGNPHLRGSF